ncbi:MAG: PIN domain-containing protein [Deltaproteobacteria bacterium]|nr:PIN domain-containing protein [Deltaproteobacteria bacterium]
MAEGVLFDTSILIPLYNENRYRERVLDLGGRTRLFFSVVAINEFIRGAHDRRSQNLVRSFLDTVKENLISPTERQWIECGSVSERILKRERRSKEKVILLQNDILIAIGARDADAILVTADRNDFTILKEFIDVAVDFW